MIQDADLPYDNPGGQHIENVSPSLSQEKAAEAIGYDEFRKEQAKARERVATSASAWPATSSRSPT